VSTLPYYYVRDELGINQNCVIIYEQIEH